MFKFHYRHFVALTAILSMPVAFSVILLGMKAANFDSAALQDPTAYVAIGSEAGKFAAWSMMADMLGYYLLVIPLILFLGDYLRHRHPQLVKFATFSGLAYTIIGAMGAAILAAVWPFLIGLYEQGQQPETVELIFKTITTLVYGGLWNILELILAGAWWVSVGLLFMRDRRVLGTVTIILGIASFINAGANMLDLESIADIGLFTYLFLAPVWALWLGILAARGFQTERENIFNMPTQIITVRH